MRKVTVLFLSLLLLLLIPIAAHAQYEVSVYPTDDAYIAADLVDQQDIKGLRTLNTGDLRYMEVGYTYAVRAVGNVTEGNSTVVPVTLTVSFGMLKFDLSNVTSNDVISAKLELTAINASLTGYSREVVIYRGRSNAWSESSVNFNNNPGYFNDTFVGGTYVANLRAKTYSWDMTQWVKESAGGQLTLYVAMKTLYPNNSEWVIFLTKENANYRPRLVLELASPPQGGEQPPPQEQPGTQPQGLDTTTILAIVAAIAVVAIAAAILLYRRRAAKPAKRGRRGRRKKATSEE